MFFDLYGDATVNLIENSNITVASITQDQNSGSINSMVFNNVDANNTYHIQITSIDCMDYDLYGWSQGFSSQNDAEPNNSQAEATSISFDQNYQGQLSFYNSGNDSQDFYAFTLTEIDDVEFILNAFEGLDSNVILTLYDSTGSSIFSLTHDGINTARTSNLVNLNPDTYYFIISESNNQTGSYEFKVTPQATLGIENINFENEVSLYPNPTKNAINIKLNNYQNVSVALYDLGGRLILEQELNSEISTVNISHLQNGMYLLKINANNQSITKRVIKQ